MFKKSMSYILILVMMVSCIVFLPSSQKVEATEQINIISSGVATAVIVRGSSASTVEVNVVNLLRDKIAEKTGVTPSVVNESSFDINNTSYTNIIILGTSSSNSLLSSEMTSNSYTFPTAAEGYKLLTGVHGSKKLILIPGTDTAGVLYGIGKFLRQANYPAADSMTTDSPLSIASAPISVERGPYFAVHCDNWYEHVNDTSELTDLVNEQALWGANIIWVWFDLSMYHKGPFDTGSDSSEKWNRIKTIANAAKNIGFKLGMIEVLNSGYLDQTEGSALADVGGEPSAGLFCPSAQSGAALDIMEDNYRELYQDLVTSAIEVGAVSQGLYDRGGCHCEDCEPWVATAVGTVAPVHDDIIRDYFPNVKDFINDWHFSDTEVAWVKNYLDTNEPTWCSGIFQDDRHAWDRWSGLPSQYMVFDFLDIAMIGGWSGYGANSFPGRLDTFFTGMRNNGFNGGMAYSEGIFDDLNKVIYLQKHWGNYTSADIIKEYSKWYFNADATRQTAIATVTSNMETEWSNIYSSWGAQSLSLNTTYNVKGQIDTIETGLSTAAKNSWRWKLLNLRTYLAKECFDISALAGSSYTEFCSSMDALLAANNKTQAQSDLNAKEAWFAQRQTDYTNDLNTLKTSVYEGGKSGMYDESYPNPTRWIAGYNNGTTWNTAFLNYQALIDDTGIPTLSSAVAGNGQVTLTFSSVYGATEYIVKYGTSSGTYTTTISGVSGSPYVVTELNNGTTYYFAVSPVVNGSENSNSNELSAAPQNGVPNAVTLTSAVAQNGAVILNFTTDAAATSYKIKYDIDSMHNNVISGVDGSPYTVTGLTNGTTYYFVVAATNAYGDSADSNEKSATPTTNLALGKTATASTEYSSVYTAANADDGQYYSSSNTFWSTQSGQTTGAWWKVDLGMGTFIDKVSIQYRGYDGYFHQVPTTLTFQVSDDNTNWTTVISKSTNVPTYNTAYNENLYSYTLNAPGRYLRLLSEDGTQGSEQYLQFVEVEVYGSSNMAKDKTVAASTEYSATYSAAKANDGQYYSSGNTYWATQTDQTTGAWWKMDLGTETYIDAVSIQYRGYNGVFHQVPTTLTFQVSDDNTNWTTVISKSTNVPTYNTTYSGNLYTYTLNASGRYLRLLSEDGTQGSEQYLEFVEIEVY